VEKRLLAKFLLGLINNFTPQFGDGSYMKISN